MTFHDNQERTKKALRRSMELIGEAWGMPIEMHEEIRAGLTTLRPRPHVTCKFQQVGPTIGGDYNLIRVDFAVSLYKPWAPVTDAAKLILIIQPTRTGYKSRDFEFSLKMQSLDIKDYYEPGEGLELANDIYDALMLRNPYWKLALR